MVCFYGNNLRHFDTVQLACAGTECTLHRKSPEFEVDGNPRTSSFLRETERLFLCVSPLSGRLFVSISWRVTVAGGDVCLFWRAWSFCASSPILCCWMFHLSPPNLYLTIQRRPWMRGVIRHFIRLMATRSRSAPDPIQEAAIVSGGRGSSGTCWATTYLLTGVMQPIGWLMPSRQACRRGRLLVLARSPSFLALMGSGPLALPDTLPLLPT